MLGLAVVVQWFQARCSRAPAFALAAIVGVGVLVVPRQAVSKPRVEYRVTAGCPEQPWFERMLSEVLATAKLGDDTLLHVSVSESSAPPAPAAPRPIQPGLVPASAGEGSGPSPAAAASPPTLLARLEYRGDWQRELSGSDCQALLSALAVSLALHQESEIPDTATGVRERGSAWRPPRIDDAAFEDPAPAEAPDAPWRYGVLLGSEISMGIQPGISHTASLMVTLQSQAAGWGSGPFGVGLTSTYGDSSFAMPGEVPLQGSWSSAYWTARLLAAPVAFQATRNTTLAPALDLHAGRLVRVSHEGAKTQSIWLAYSSVLVLLQAGAGAWHVQLHGGLQLPISPFTVRVLGHEVHRQQLGPTAGLAVLWQGGN